MAIQLRPDYGVAHFNLGNFYARQGRFDLAQIHFEEALRLYPNYAEAHRNFGQLLAQQGDLEGGIREFRKAIDLNPSLDESYLNLGSRSPRGRIEEAAGPFMAARLTPESVEAHYSLGSVYASQERYDEAAKAFKDALRVRGDFAAANQSLAQLLSLQGKKKEAIEHYQEALRLMRKQGAATGQ
jgi:tetratricopeptide (TPR) repeat protein